jgi:hypothetical protein
MSGPNHFIAAPGFSQEVAWAMALQGPRASAAHQSGPHAPPPSPRAAQLLQRLGAAFPAGQVAPAFSFHRVPSLEPQQPAAGGGTRCTAA